MKFKTAITVESEIDAPNAGTAIMILATQIRSGLGEEGSARREALGNPVIGDAHASGEQPRQALRIEGG